MRKRRDGKNRFGVAAIAWLVIFETALAPAAEPARQFLQGLRDRGYYDTAVDT